MDDFSRIQDYQEMQLISSTSCLIKDVIVYQNYTPLLILTILKPVLNEGLRLPAIKLFL